MQINCNCVGGCQHSPVDSKQNLKLCYDLLQLRAFCIKVMIRAGMLRFVITA